MTLFKFLSGKLYKSRTVTLRYTMVANVTATINYGNALFTGEMCSSRQALMVPLLCSKPPAKCSHSCARAAVY